jgi:DNA adenine methylase
MYDAIAPPATLPPPLKWAGGKRWQVPHLRPLWAPHAHRRLVEPFCGGLAVSLGLMPDRAVVNDTNPHLVSFYRWLKKGLTIEIPMLNDRTLFYEYRDRFNDLLAANQGHTIEAASLFYYLNRTGYNGLCRFNQQGEFNVPFGRYKRIGYRSDLTEYRDVLAAWEITNDDVESLPLRRDDFVYADPPYDVEFTQYAQGGFSWEDQERTAVFLAKHPGPVILVNQATRRIRKLYRDLEFETTILDAPRRISCTGDRTPAREILATKNL